MSDSAAEKLVPSPPVAVSVKEVPHAESKKPESKRAEPKPVQLTVPRRRQFSLRYKLLLVITLIPLITLATYLALAVQIFKNDKIAYVFDSSSNFVGTLASQVRSQVQSVLSDAKPFLQSFVTNQTFDQLTKDQFLQAPSMSLIAVVEFDPAYNIDFKSILSKSAAEEKLILGEITSYLSHDKTVLKDLQDNQRAIIQLKNLDYVFMENVVLKQEQKKLYFFIVSSLRDLTESFQSGSVQKTFLIKNSGNILVGPDSEVQNLADFLPFDDLKSKIQKLAQGVEETINNRGEEVLLSFSKTGYSDLTVVSVIEKSKALSAVGILIRRSLYFFGILICVTIIVSLLASNQLTSAITQLFSATQKVSQGDFSVQVEVKSNDEISSLASNFNLMAQQIARLMLDTAQKARMENELQTARTVQETLFPIAEMVLGPMSIAGHYEPASECGGDWWHYCFVGEKIYLWMGDATGHGAPAALITSAAKSAATLIESLQISPAAAIELMNKAIYDVSKGRIMMTFVLSSFDLKTGELTYVNASHEAPFLLRNESGKPLKKKDIILLNENNNPRLGQGRDSAYKESTIKLMPQDFLFFYTDGIADIQDKELKSWGERDFIKTLLSVYNEANDPIEFKNKFTAKMRDYRKEQALIDDVTFFAVKYGEQKNVEV